MYASFRYNQIIDTVTVTAYLLLMNILLLRFRYILLFYTYSYVILCSMPSVVITFKVQYYYRQYTVRFRIHSIELLLIYHLLLENTKNSRLLYTNLAYNCQCGKISDIKRIVYFEGCNFYTLF